jgi:hypothetical protein
LKSCHTDSLAVRMTNTKWNTPYFGHSLRRTHSKQYAERSSVYTYQIITLWVWRWNSSKSEVVLSGRLKILSMVFSLPKSLASELCLLLWKLFNQKSMPVFASIQLMLYLVEFKKILALRAKKVPCSLVSTFTNERQKKKHWNNLENC